MSQMNSRSSVTLPLHSRFGLASLVSTALLVCLLASAPNVQAQGWSSTGSLGIARSYGHTATLLANGKVLVVGGPDGSSPCCRQLGNAELYDPATGQWSATGSLSTPRVGHIAVRLANGKVLVAGGGTSYLPVIGVNYTYNNAEISAEIYDPDTGAWSATGNLSVARVSHTETLLADGRVLVTGGYGVGSVVLNNAELYDPATGAWKPAGTMNSPRSLHTATLLPGGGVLVVGGLNTIFYPPLLRSAELYDPATGSWTATRDAITARVLHTATLLHNGKVLVAGGVRVEPFDHYGDGVDKAELYGPATGQWSATGSLAASRVVQTATLLPNGRVLVAGGYSDYNIVSTAELYDPVTASWSVTGSLKTVHSEHAATLLASGKVLVVGGGEELYDPGFEIPLLTLNATSYCIGDPWTVSVTRSMRSASVQLLGVSNGASWAIARWGATDQDGGFSANGIMAGGTEGTHTLSVEISGIRSNAFSFAVSKCKP
jgi:N-acetylneuraminic acid mutarotase